MPQIKGSIKLSDNTEAQAKFSIQFFPSGMVTAGYQKVLKNTTTDDEKNEGEYCQLKLTDQDKDAIFGAITPIISEIIIADVNSRRAEQQGSAT